MWPNPPRPSSRTSAGDNYNNSAANPYSRNAAGPKAKPGRQSSDPWDWGWEDNSAQQDEWNNGWNQAPTPVPNVIPNPPPSLYHQTKPENKARGTPDLIPEKINNGGRGNMMQFGQQHYNQTSNASEFFENINLVGQNHQTTPLYPATEVRRPPQPNIPQQNIPQNYHMYQQMPPHNAINRCPTPASYFHQPPPPPSHTEPMSYYQQPPPSLTPNVYQNSQFYQPELNNQMSASKNSGSYFDRNQFTSQEHYNYYEPNAYLNNSPIQAPASSDPSYNPVPNVNTVEVENVEVAPPERTTAPVTQSEASWEPDTQNSQEVNRVNNLGAVDETSIPDNQETVPDNEEHLQNLPQKLSQLKISSSNNLETWNSSPGWENQEVAPRCELDRNQYLETGQLVDSNEAEEVTPETDNNDEGEALPPPGLHRLVTGQGTESISQRSVLGQPPSIPQGNSGFVRLVPGQLTPSVSPEPSSLERLVPGQQNNEEILLNSSHRLVPGHQSQDSQSSQRFSNHQEPQGEMQRLIPGQVQSDPPIGVRMIPGQLSDDENNLNTGDMERMIPGGLSEHENSFPEEIPDDERMVPGGMSDDSRSQSISMDDERQNSSERMIPGMTMQTVINPPQSESQPERLVTGAGMVDSTEPSLSSSQDLTRHVMGQRNGGVEPPPGLHRLVLGQINSEANTDTEHGTAKTSERVEESAGGNVPPGMHRLVVGQFREKEAEPENDKEKETVKSNDREDDSDSDYKSDRRRQRHRRDSYDDERKERDYSSEREYRGKRDDRREYRKKRDASYNRTPEYQSDHEEYERNDYRDRRDRDRRDRPRDRERDRRRRSPDYSYESYHRDDPRKLPPRERDRRYYEPYEDDPYYYRENRSRPSSRSGSEYRRHRDYPRQPYYPEQGGMGNYMHYYQIQQYYENMRRNDPQAYAMWYERYMAEKFGSASNDRASVHSGRSSANDNSHLQEKRRRRIPMSTPKSSPATQVKSRSLLLPHNWSFTCLSTCLDEEDKEGVKADDTASHRSTPPLYSSAHIRGNMNTFGHLVVVNPHDPFSYGEHQPTVTVCKIAGPNAADSPDTLEFLHNPGPFISGVTHKNTVLQYLKKQCDQFSHSSEKLLYELIRLVIKLNGVVDMTDVADLLMENYRNSSSEEEDFPDTTPAVNVSPPLSPHQITSKFRQLLLEGNKTEALEWAMKNKDWGHALFLASKMDSRTHNNVMLRFANGLPNNDPLQTLYQLMSGREPQAATCAADKKWGDWRPHLAMMLSNRTANVELDRKAILTLGDSLGARDRLFASHFCYLTAQLEFSNYSDRHAKLVLLGASPDRPLSQFASCRAIMLTLCYEYAKQLSNKEWCIPTLRPYKFLLACRLWDHGNLQAALAYLEALAQEMVRLPRRDDKALTQLVVDMADKLKCADSSLSYSSDPASDPDWLARLKIHVEETNDPSYLPTGLTHGISTSTVSELDTVNGGELMPQPAIQDMNHQTYQHSMVGYAADPSTGGYVQNNYYGTSQNSYFNPPQDLSMPEEVQQNLGYNAEHQHLPADNSSRDYWSATTTGGGWDQQPAPAQELPPVEPTMSQPTVNLDSQPQISVKPGFGYIANSEDNVKPQIEKPVGLHPTEKLENKDKTNRRTNKTQQSGSGWFGGIWDKLARRPNNQMKLPDDKNPPIVWDEKSKRWVNTDASEEEQSAQLKPPPKASELNGAAILAAPTLTSTSAPAPGPGVAHTGLPPPSTTSTNIYKLQRGKGMRGNYVDIMGSNKKPISANTNPQPFSTMPQAPVTNFFVPAPVPGNENAPVDFLSPSGPVSYEPVTNKSDDQPPPGGFGKGNSLFYNPTK